MITNAMFGLLKYEGKEMKGKDSFVWILKIKGKERNRRKLVLPNLIKLVSTQIWQESEGKEKNFNKKFNIPKLPLLIL